MPTADRHRRRRSFPCSCGTVVMDVPGAYLTASLLLTGCVHLRLPENVTLLAGDRVRRPGLAVQ